MDCIPSALVRTDWGALTGLAGVGATLIVGWCFASRIQKRQAEAARVLAQNQVGSETREIAEAVVHTMDALLNMADWWDTDEPVVRKLAEIDQHVRVIDNLLIDRVANTALLRLVVDAHASVAGVQSVLREVASLEDPLKQNLARGWAWSGASMNNARWLRIRTSAAAYRE